MFLLFSLQAKSSNKPLKEKTKQFLKLWLTLTKQYGKKPKRDRFISFNERECVFEIEKERESCVSFDYNSDTTLNHHYIFQNNNLLLCCDNWTVCLTELAHLYFESLTVQERDRQSFKSSSCSITMISHSPPIFSHSPPVSFLADFMNNRQSLK